jgi:hypothetical protein
MLPQDKPAKIDIEKRKVSLRLQGFGNGYIRNTLKGSVPQRRFTTLNVNRTTSEFLPDRLTGECPVGTQEA